MKSIYYFTIGLFLSLSSCFTEELPVVPHKAGDVETGTAVLRELYTYQVFYDLSTNKALKTNLISDWELGFEAADSGWHIILNNSRFMHAGNTGTVNFEAVNTYEGLIMEFDSSDGNPDSTAIGNWIRFSEGDTLYSNHVYVIDMGFNENFEHSGYKKVLFQSLSNNAYSIKYADLTGENEKTTMIEKDNTKNYVCFSFENGVVDIEPHKNEWSLLFTKYTTLLFTDLGEPYPYSVVGVHLNPNQVRAGLDTLKSFETIVLADTANYEFTNQRDFIGYKWKYYDFDAGTYSIVPDLNYLIKNHDGFYYKLRFIDFYSHEAETLGEKGFPTFEFQKL